MTIDTILSPPSAPTAAQLTAALGASLAIAEAIRGLGRPIPSGELYARVMGALSLDAYLAILRTLQGAGVVAIESDLIRWTGPAS